MIEFDTPGLCKHPPVTESEVEQNQTVTQKESKRTHISRHPAAVIFFGKAKGYDFPLTEVTLNATLTRTPDAFELWVAHVHRPPSDLLSVHLHKEPKSNSTLRWHPAPNPLTPILTANISRQVSVHPKFPGRRSGASTIWRINSHETCNRRSLPFWRSYQYLGHGSCHKWSLSVERSSLPRPVCFDSDKIWSHFSDALD